LADDAAQIRDLPCGTVDAEFGRRLVERVEQGFLEIFVFEFSSSTPAPREQGVYAAFRIDAGSKPQCAPRVGADEGKLILVYGLGSYQAQLGFWRPIDAIPRIVFEAKDSNTSSCPTRILRTAKPSET
jgi:hypothetical protein